jgi:hypothetical protein
MYSMPVTNPFYGVAVLRMNASFLCPRITDERLEDNVNQAVRQGWRAVVVPEVRVARIYSTIFPVLSRDPRWVISIQNFPLLLN